MLRQRHFAAVGWILLLPLVAALVTSCARSGPPTKAGVTIGAVLSLTGDGAKFGQDQRRGIELATDELNSRPSRQYDYRVFFEDSRTQPKDGVSAFQKLMGQSPRPPVVLTTMSSISMALKPLAIKEKIVLFCIAAHPQLTGDNDYVFRAFPTAGYQAKLLAREAVEQAKCKTFGLLYSNDDFGVGCRETFRAEVKSRGGSVVAEQSLELGKTDYRSAITSVLGAKPEAIYVAAYQKPLALALRQTKELGYNGRVLSTIEITYPEVLGAAKGAAEGVMFVDTAFDPKGHSHGMQKFATAFKRKFGRDPGPDAVFAYDEIRLVAQAAEATEPTGSGIAKGLHSIADYESPNGKVAILPNGDIGYPLQLKVIRGGRGVPYPATG